MSIIANFDKIHSKKELNNQPCQSSIWNT